MLPPQPAPVGGRLSEFVEGWKRITNDPYVLSIVTKGYRLRFMSLEVPPNSSGFYSKVFLVHRASGGWHPVKCLNAHIFAPHFRMFTTTLLSSEHRKGDYTFKIDLQDAYLHVPFHPSSRKYLRFAFENKVYQFRVLSFGLNTAPQIFTRLGDTVTGYLYCLGISVIPYLDDWLVHHPDHQVLLRHQVQLLKTLFKDLVGFTLNRKKSELDFITGLQCFRATRSR